MAYIKEPTAKQKMLIKKIEEALHVKFKGVSCKEASDFISANMDAFKAVPKADEPATSKQQYLILKMEEVLQIAFNGSSKREASQFISEHIEEYHTAQEMMSADNADSGTTADDTFDPGF